MNNNFLSLMMRFTNDFHSWLRQSRSHSWKSLANHLTRNQKIVIHSNSCIILYILICHKNNSAHEGWYNKVHHNTWWCHQMETFSASLAIYAGNSPVPGEFPAERPVTRRFDVFFYLRLIKRLSKQWWGWWFEMPSYPLWRHCNEHLKSHNTIH